MRVGKLTALIILIMKYIENYFQIRIKDLINAGLLDIKIPSPMSMRFETKDDFNPYKYLQAYIVPGDDHIDIIIMYEFKNYHTRVVFTTPNYGGSRAWFICPITLEKCTVLFWNSIELGSRKGLGLKYIGDNRDKLFLYLDTSRDFNKELENIRYPYRNGKPTRKFKRVVRGYKKAGLREANAYDDFLFSKVYL